MGKIKIGFNPDDAWDYQTFRDLIRESLIENDEIETYLITTNTDTAYVDSIVDYFGTLFDLNNVFMVSADIDIVQTIQDEGIQIYLSDNYQLIESINNNTDCVGIVVSSIPDRYKMQPKYITDLNFWIKRLIESTNNAQEAC
jgi:hypothetical protein